MVELLEQQPQLQGEPMFDAPWQARTFAMTVKLHESGLFSWKEWSDLLATNIDRHEQSAVVENNTDYYTIWQQSLEEILRQKLPDQG